MRLDRYIANNTQYSRKEVKQLLKQGLVQVNDNTVKNAGLHIAPDDLVQINGELVESLGLGYFMLNKPEGAVCANSDADHPTIFDYVDEPHSGLHVAGRLDIDTTGLVLITGDGQWSHQITSPNKGCVKTYQVITEEFVTDTMIKKLESGIFLRPENIRTKEAKVEKVAADEILLHISEGKYHQVKRMLHAVDNAVDSLHRLQIGPIKLDEQLAPGEYRPLTAAEIESVYDNA